MQHISSYINEHNLQLITQLNAKVGDVVRFHEPRRWPLYNSGVLFYLSVCLSVWLCVSCFFKAKPNKNCSAFAGTVVMNFVFCLLRNDILEELFREKHQKFIC